MVNLFLFNFYISDSNHIASDGTYKLIYQGFPILMIGTTDFNREYHPYGIMVTKHENEEDYEYLFSTLKNLVFTIHKVEFNPTILLADCSGAITNGFSKVFNLIHRVFCWSHVKRAYDKKLNSVTDPKIRSQISTDIVHFQHYVRTETFTQVARLMITSWRQKFTNNEQVETFIKYFIQQWLNPNRMGWFDHYIQHVPCQDNALESTNRYMKEECLRPRLPINEFLAQLEDGK